MRYRSIALLQVASKIKKNHLCLRRSKGGKEDNFEENYLWAASAESISLIGELAICCIAFKDST